MPREVIFEFFHFGNTVKVTAFDVETHIEVSTITPAHLSTLEQERAALNKLNYVLAKKGYN